MNKSSRLQRSRQTKLPPGTVCVTRPGKWGNPFKKGERGIETNEDILLEIANGKAGE